jgi:MinD superfamily P-loop ATPase
MVDDIMVFPKLCHSCYACSELCPEGALPMEKEKIGELNHFRGKNLDFVESRLMIGEEQAVPLIAQTSEYVDQNLPGADLVIMDSPPGTSCPMIEAVKDADLIILVTEPTPFGLHDLKLAVETAEKLDKRHAVVVNRFGIGNDDVIDYCRDKGIDIPAMIPNDRRIATLYAGGDLLKIPSVQEQLERVSGYIRRVREEVAG